MTNRDAYALAVDEDVQANYPKAVVLYLEAILLEDNVPVDAYTNLGVLLFLLGTDYFSFEQQFAEKVLNFAFWSYRSVLVDGTYEFPNGRAIAFWLDYVDGIMGRHDFPMRSWEEYALNLEPEATLGDEILMLRHSKHPRIQDIVSRSLPIVVSRCKASRTRKNLELLFILQP